MKSGKATAEWKVWKSLVCGSQPRVAFGEIAEWKVWKSLVCGSHPRVAFGKIIVVCIVLGRGLRDGVG